jgi:methyl-accepting chemotaxis protein
MDNLEQEIFSALSKLGVQAIGEHGVVRNAFEEIEKINNKIDEVAKSINELNEISRKINHNVNFFGNFTSSSNKILTNEQNRYEDFKESFKATLKLILMSTIVILAGYGLYNIIW